MNQRLSPQQSDRPATIHDVAASAEVAVGTVSRYLNGKPIRESNRIKVEEAIQRLSFVRNMAAATIRNDGSRMVGFLVSSYDQMQIDVLNRLTGRMQAQGRLVLPITHDGSEELLQRALHFFAEHRIDVLVASGDFPDLEKLQYLSSLNSRIVLFNNDIAGLQADRIMFNDVDGMNLAVSRLIALGHRRIGLIAGLPSHTSAANRLQGYRSALAQSGIRVDEELIVGHSWDRRDGYLGAGALFDLASPPTAIVSANYLTALGALEFFNERRISVPSDVSLISYGDADALPLISGGIDAVILPTDRLVDAIEQICRSQSRQTLQSISLDCQLLTRGSTRSVGGPKIDTTS